MSGLDAAQAQTYFTVILIDACEVCEKKNESVQFSMEREVLISTRKMSVQDSPGVTFSNNTDVLPANETQPQSI